MNGNLLTRLATAGMLFGLMAAMYVSDRSPEVTSIPPVQNRSLGIAGLLGVAFAFVIIRFTIGRKD